MKKSSEEMLYCNENMISVIVLFVGETDRDDNHHIDNDYPTNLPKKLAEIEFTALSRRYRKQKDTMIRRRYLQKLIQRFS